MLVKCFGLTDISQCCCSYVLLVSRYISFLLYWPMNVSMLSIHLQLIFVASNTLILPNFLMRKFYGNAQFSQNFGRVAQNSADTKISKQEIRWAFVFFMQWLTVDWQNEFENLIFNEKHLIIDPEQTLTFSYQVF